MSHPPAASTGARRTPSRRSVLASSAAIAGAVAGCLSLGDDDPDGRASAQEDGDEADDELAEVDLLEVVPATATVLAHLQADDLDRDEYDRVLDEVSAVETGDIDVSTAFPGFEARTGIDPSETNELLRFDDGAEDDEDDENGATDEDQDGATDGQDDVGDDGQDGTADDGQDDAGAGDDADDGAEGDAPDDAETDEPPMRFLVDVDRGREEFVEEIEAATGAEYEVGEYEPEENEAEENEGDEYDDEDVLYEPIDGDGDAILVGVLGDGQYAIGRREDVTAVLDVRFANADPISGQVVEAFEEVRGANLSVSGEQHGPIVPEEFRDLLDFDAIETISRSYDLIEEGVDLRLLLWTGDPDDAEAIESQLYAARAFLQGTADDEETADALGDVQIRHEEGEVMVEVRYEGDLEHVEDLVGEI